MSAAALTAFAMAVVAVLGQTAPDVVVHTINGAQPAAPLVEIGANFDIQLGGKNPQKYQVPRSSRCASPVFDSHLVVPRHSSN